MTRTYTSPSCKKHNTRVVTLRSQATRLTRANVINAEESSHTLEMMYKAMSLHAQPTAQTTSNLPQYGLGKGKSRCTMSTAHPKRPLHFRPKMLFSKTRSWQVILMDTPPSGVMQTPMLQAQTLKTFATQQIWYVYRMKIHPLHYSTKSTAHNTALT